MFFVLAWMACTSGSNAGSNAGTSSWDRTPRDPEPVPEVEPARAVAMPEGRAVARQCFGSDRDLERRRGGSLGNKGSNSPMPTTASPAPMKPAPKRLPNTRSTASAPSGLASGTESSSGLTGGSGGYGGKADAVAAVPPPPPPASAPMAEAAPAADEGAAWDPAPASEPEATRANEQGELASRSAREEEKAKKAESRPTDGLDKDMGPGRAARQRMVAQPARPSVDWGGITYLSNDDSMSLASAQRLLYDVKQHVDFKPSEVRPHELLNYFSFDTAPVSRGNLFSVMGSATQVGPDTLSLALAVQGAKPAHQALDLTLVVDVSGSMWAEGRIEYVKRGLQVLADQLVRGDRVDLVIFDHEVCTPLEDFVSGRDDDSLLRDAISALEPRGSTDLDLGLKEGYRLAGRWVSQDGAKERNHRVMVLTDALLNTGDINPDTVSEVGKAYESWGVRLTGVGVGREFNDAMLDKLTEKGKGAFVYLGSEAVVDRVFGAGFESLTRTIAHDVRFALDLPESLGLAKFYGEESSSDPEDIQPIHYYSGTSQVFLQDLRMRDGRPVNRDEITLTISYRDPATDREDSQTWTGSIGELLDAERHNVDKARALIAWTDFLQARAMHGEPCGAPLDRYRAAAAKVSDDAEIAYVNSLTGPLCSVDMSPPQGVAYRVKLDSDIPIAEVALHCPSGDQRQSLSAGDSVARFNATPGTCTLTLQGTVPMIAKVTVPVTGGDTRCVVRGGRVSCS